MYLRFQSSQASPGDWNACRVSWDKRSILSRQHLPGSRNRIAFIVQEDFNLDNSFNVRSGIDSLARRIFFGPQCREFGLPIPQDMRLHAEKLRDFTDLKKGFGSEDNR